MNTLGIDLGTSNSSASVAVDMDRILMIQSRHGSGPHGKNFPSYVEFDKNGELVSTGEPAKRAMTNSPKLVIWGAKRLVGLTYKGAANEAASGRFKYEIEEGLDGTILVKVGPKRYTPADILERILQEIKSDAENPTYNPLFGGTFDRAVISVPANFGAARANHIVAAAHRAGFEYVDTIAEPTAAAVRYGLEIDKEAVVLAFDLGGGTLDVTVLQIVRDGDALIPGELCTGGNEGIGGMDMDDALLSLLVQKYQWTKDVVDMWSWYLRNLAEDAKIRLSTKPEALIDFPGFEPVILRRGEMEEALSGLLERCRWPIRTALKKSGLDASAIDHVVMVGGPLRMPCVRRMLREELRALGARAEVLAEIDRIEEHGFPVSPTECVSQGAALKAASLISPVSTIISEGYGAILGGGYTSIIEPDSAYPIDGKAWAIFADPNGKHLNLTLVTKRIRASRAADVPSYEYRTIGKFGISRMADGKLPSIEISISVSTSKEIAVRLTDEYDRGNHADYTGANVSEGEENVLSEKAAPGWDSETKDKFLKNYSPEKGAWSERHMNQLKDFANSVLAMGSGANHENLRDPVRALQKCLTEAREGVIEKPHYLANRTRELLFAMRRIESLSESDYQRHLSELEKIGI